MNFLIINSIKKYSFSAIFDLIDELITLDYKFTLLSKENDLFQFFQKKGLATKNFPTIFQNNYLTILFYPFYFLIYFFSFLFIKIRRKNKNILLFGDFEKITNTIPALIFKKNVYWINFPNKEKKNKITKKILQLTSCFVKIIVFSNHQKESLIQKGFNANNIFVINLGIKNNNRQENIFEEIAEVKNIKKGEQKFIIGTVADVDDFKKIEVLFYAVKKSLTIIPNVQLIIIGDSQERKRISWLAKRMEIESIVWFVGEQKYLHKWFANFDILVLVCEYLKINNINTIEKAMFAGLPVIAQKNIGFEHFAKNNQNSVLVDINNSADLLDEIINLFQNKNFYKKISENAKKEISENFYLAKTIKELEEIWKK